MKQIDVIIIGAGAAGLMCAIEAAKRHRQVLVLDHANKPGKKILMSGGGRCNFTNLYASAEQYLSHNPHFCRSALSRYTPRHFIDLVKRHGIPFHEKKLGQLFCDNSAKDLLNMLLSECASANAQIRMNTSILSIQQIHNHGFEVETPDQQYRCDSLVIATGGLSIPTMGASPFGYKIAEQFGLPIYPTRAGLVPFTLSDRDKAELSPLSGISNPCTVKAEKMQFKEDLLFTHRGLSGPAILQISNYWTVGEPILINLIPDADLIAAFQTQKKNKPNQSLKDFFAPYLPKRVIATFLPENELAMPLQSLSSKAFDAIAARFIHWQIKPQGTEGYRTAEVTLGGVDTNALSSKTMECNTVKGLYLIGEVVDVTGWLGGYNFQWAWASGWAAGQVV